MLTNNFERTSFLQSACTKPRNMIYYKHIREAIAHKVVDLGKKIEKPPSLPVKYTRVVFLSKNVEKRY